MVLGDINQIGINDCKSWCTDSCRELINKSMFNDSLWMVYAGLVILFIYWIFRHNLINNDRVRTELIRRNYNIEKLNKKIHWIMVMGMFWIIAFIVKFLYFTNTVKPLG